MNGIFWGGLGALAWCVILLWSDNRRLRRELEASRLALRLEDADAEPAKEYAFVPMADMTENELAYFISHNVRWTGSEVVSLATFVQTLCGKKRWDESALRSIRHFAKAMARHFKQV